MNGTINMTFAAIIGTVFLILMCVSTIVGSILFFAGRPRSGVRRAGGSMVLVCGSVLTMGFVAGLVLAVFAVSQDRREAHVRAEAKQRLKEMSQRLHAGPPPPPPMPIPAAPPQTVLKAEAEANIDAGLQRLPEAEAPADANRPQPERIEPLVAKPVRPAWVSANESRHGDVRLVTLSSKKYATLEEAELELGSALVRLLRDDYRSVFHMTADRLPSLPVWEFRSLTVKQEHVETTTTDFGNFTAPMHRVWWQVELSPEVRMKLRAIWKEQTQDQRTWTVAGTLGGITVLLAGLSLLTRRRHAVMG